MNTKKQYIKIILIILIFFLDFSAYANQSSAQNINRLIDLINQRLSLIKEVAAQKSEHINEIYAPEREQVVLVHTKNLARRYDLSVPKLLVYSQIMMDTAKQLEYYNINQWKKANDLPHIKNNNLKEIRLKLLAIDKEIFFTINKLSKYKNIRVQLSQDFNKQVYIPESLNLYKQMLLEVILSILA